jgi:CheY-like chemotaxis protein
MTDDSDEIRPTVLVVDDEQQNLELMEVYLLRDYDVVFASSGKEALQKLEEEKTDLVLLDIMMPEMDGYEVCRRIKENKNLPYTPIIMITALSEKEALVKGLESGAEEFLSKPVDKLELITRVRSLLRTKKYYDALVDERNQLAVQNRIREVLTAIIPFLLGAAPPEQKKMLIRQMIEMVENTVYRHALENRDISSNIETTRKTGCSILNEMGGSYYPGRTEEGLVEIKADKCPWGEKTKINPIMCNLTAGILSRLIDSSGIKGDVRVNKTLGNGDDFCSLDLYLSK